MKSFLNTLAQTTRFAVVLAITLGGPLAARAQSAQELPFIGPGGGGASPLGAAPGWLQFTSLSTNSFGSPNLAYIKNYSATNILASFTNLANGLVTTGYISSVVPNYVTNAAGFSDVTLWADRDGTAPDANLTLDINGINANFTNTVTFNFTCVTPYGVALTQGQNLFAVTMTGNGTNDVALSTNVPLTFLQGQRRLRLASIVSAGPASNGTNGQAMVWFDGYKPEGGL